MYKVFSKNEFLSEVKKKEKKKKLLSRRIKFRSYKHQVGINIFDYFQILRNKCFALYSNQIPLENRDENFYKIGKRIGRII